MVIGLNIIVILAFVYWGYQYAVKSDLRIFYWPAITLKILAGFSVGLIYTVYYNGGDTWGMFYEAVKLKEAAFSSLDHFMDIYFAGEYSAIPDFSYAVQPRAAFMSKIIAPFTLMTGENYWLVSSYLSLFSFAGFWLLANTIYNFTKNKWVAVIPTLFYPSIVFWSSGVLKESIAIGSLAILFSILTQYYLRKKIKWHTALLVIINLLLLMQLKYYYAAVITVAYLTLFLASIITPKKSRWYIELASVFGLFTIIASLASLTHPNLWPSRILSVIVDNYYQYAALSTDNNLVIFNNLSPTVFSFVWHSPKALFAGLFFPLWVSSTNLFKIFSMVENWLLLSAFVYSLRKFSMPEDRDKRLLLFVMVGFIVIMAVFITFSSPNIGTLVRYRIGYLIMFVALIGVSISSQKKAP